MANRKGNQFRTEGTTNWRDVWVWADDLYKSHGLCVRVEVNPPLPSQRDVRSVVVVVAYVVSVKDPREGSKHTKWRNVRYTGPDEVTTALQLLVEMSKWLDERVGEAERTPLEAGALF